MSIDPSCRWAVLLGMLALAAGNASAESQKVFRCGPEGRTYSQTPCKDGYEVNADDTRTPEQRKAAEEAVKRESAMAEKMRRERLAEEAAAAKRARIVVVPVGSAPAASAVAAKRKRPLLARPVQG